MNYLAHALLSKPDIEFRLGNLLADLVRGRHRAAMSPAFREGIRHHQKIDAFTDTHPAAARSRARLHEPFGHAAGILVDIFYDHFLALDWDRYSPEPADAFAARLCADIRACPMALPPEAQAAVDRLLQFNWLAAAASLNGIENALRRVSARILARTGRDLALEHAIGHLVRHFDDLHADFTEFFPQLQAHVAESPAA